MKIMIQLYIVQYSEDYDLVFTMSMQRDFKIDSQSLYADIIYASIFFIFDAQLVKCSWAKQRRRICGPVGQFSDMKQFVCHQVAFMEKFCGRIGQVIVIYHRHRPILCCYVPLLLQPTTNF